MESSCHIGFFGRHRNEMPLEKARSTATFELRTTKSVGVFPRLLEVGRRRSSATIAKSGGSCTNR